MLLWMASIVSTISMPPLARAMSNAIQDAGIDPTEMDYINGAWDSGKKKKKKEKSRARHTWTE